MRNDGSYAARPSRFAVGFAGVAFVADDGARPNVGSDVEQNVEVTRVGGFAACQVEGDDIAGGVRFRVDLRGEAAARASERLPFLPPLLQRRHMRAHDRRVEHLDQVRGRTHRGKRVEEGFEDASLAQSVEAFPYAVPGTKAFRQGAPSNVLDREEMERLKEAPVVVAPSVLAGEGRRETPSAYTPNLPHPSLGLHASWPPIRSETYESCLIQPRNPKNLIRPKFVHTT